MKIRCLSLSLALLWGVSGAGFAADAVDAAPAEMPKSPEAMAASMWDFTRNPEYLKDPKKFVPWLNAALEPSFYSGLGMQMMDPGMWALMVNSMMHPGAYSAWMPLLTDPNVYMKWLTATLDPNFYTALLTQLSDPGKMMRWAMSPVDPKTLNMFMQSLNPNMYLKWLMSPLDPHWLQAMVTPINPNAYMGWLGASMNPGSYGELWKGFLSPTQPGGYGGMPGGTTGTAAYPTPAYGTPGYNPFDPAALAKMFAVPGLPTPVPSGSPQPYFNPLDPNAWSQLWQLPLQAPPAAK
jgi:hypothetical protein